MVAAKKNVVSVVPDRLLHMTAEPPTDYLRLSGPTGVWSKLGGPSKAGEYVSPRDGDGHGSHTSSTIGGNFEVAANINGVDFGSISGVAPAAKIAAYKVCWSGPDATTTDDDGCAESDNLEALDQAIADGVDVINFSLGGSPAQSTFSTFDQVSGSGGGGNLCGGIRWKRRPWRVDHRQRRPVDHHGRGEHHSGL